MSCLDLPDADDDGPTVEVCPLPVPKQKPRASACKSASKPRAKPKMKRPSSARTSGEPEALQALPDSDDLGPVFSSDEPCGSHQVPKDYLEYDDDTLKAAAAKIPSNVMLPYSDLPFGSPPASQNVRCTLWEIFSLPRLQATMQQLGGTCRRTYDIKHFWDLGIEVLQRTLLVDILVLQPLSTFLSPPCTWVSPLQHTNCKRMKVEKRVPNLIEAMQLIDMAMWIAYIQLTENRIFAFEHPDRSLAWDRDSVTWFYQNRDAPNPCFFVFRI